MAAIDPFLMHDKVDPDDDKDPEEVIKAASTADDRRERPKGRQTGAEGE